YARRHGIGKWYSDAAELINDPRINAIYIATPPDSHTSYAVAAMQAGKPVYVEKPMARTYAECLQMLEVSENTGLPLRVAYYRRALPAFLEAKELIESGEIGQPTGIRLKLHWPAKEKGQSKQDMNWRVSPEIAGAGHFFDLASHQFDYLDFVFGKVTGITGSASNLGGLYEAEDTVRANWLHASGVTGAGSWSFIASEDDEADVIEITGDEGSIRLSCFEKPDVLRLTKNGQESVLQFDNPQHISQHLVQQVVDELRGVGQCVSTGISAARTNWVLEQVVKDYYKSRG
ncbi:MAG: Gfo/Idh/MocA family oxidoreductase, partial [Xanthomonadales bacterium]|nr:Gfo/Idh/MocA family oxidoreductase [Xanthomonadales bacterium]